MKCQFKHHGESHDQELGTCSKHPQQELKCGAFNCRFCPQCNPTYAAACRLCGTPRYACTC